MSRDWIKCSFLLLRVNQVHLPFAIFTMATCLYITNFVDVFLLFWQITFYIYQTGLLLLLTSHQRKTTRSSEFSFCQLTFLTYISKWIKRIFFKSAKYYLSNECKSEIYFFPSSKISLIESWNLEFLEFSTEIRRFSILWSFFFFNF